MLMSFFTLLFLLVAVHAVCDFPLQNEAIALEKSRHSTSALQKHVPWFYWLSAHALTHGLAVALVTGSVLLGVLETLAHWAIDFGKCEKWYSVHVDQSLHVVCKVTWAAAFLFFS